MIVEYNFHNDFFTNETFKTTSGHAKSFEETYAWIKPKLRKIPITRLVNLTPLDNIDIPIWQAVTPLAKDLTVHSGKGTSSLASKLSAIMEAIERVSSEYIDQKFIVKQSYLKLVEEGNTILNPFELNLPFNTVYDDERVIFWAYGLEIISNKQYLLPLDSIITPSRENIFEGVETNGIASGNNYTEAVLHAIYELIERYATSIIDFSDRYSEESDPSLVAIKMIDIDTVPVSCKRLIEKLHFVNISISIRDISILPNIFTYAVTLIDDNFVGNPYDSTYFAGYGCDINPENALLRAITEGIQAHSSVNLGSRDTFEGLESIPNRIFTLKQKMRVFFYPRYFPFPSNIKIYSQKQYDCLSYILKNLREKGFDKIFVINLSKSNIDVPVVRVIIKGMDNPYGSSSRRPSKNLLRILSL